MLNRQGLSNRAIARELDYSPTTVGNELKRGTPPRKSCKGRAPGYQAKRHGLFSTDAEEMGCTHARYNEAWVATLPLGVMELP